MLWVVSSLPPGHSWKLVVPVAASSSAPRNTAYDTVFPSVIAHTVGSVPERGGHASPEVNSSVASCVHSVTCEALSFLTGENENEVGCSPTQQLRFCSDWPGFPRPFLHSLES